VTTSRGHVPRARAQLSIREQRAVILQALQRGPKTSYDLRRLGSYQCPTRIFELRNLGHSIETARVTVVDRDGFSHARVALYTLLTGSGISQ
jgi:hypothetical protein